MAVRRSGRALGCRRVCVRDDYGALLYLFGRLPLLAWRGIVLTIGGCVKQVLLIPPQGLLRLSMSLMRCFSDVFFCSLVPSKLEPSSVVLRVYLETNFYSYSKQQRLPIKSPASSRACDTVTSQRQS